MLLIYDAKVVCQSNVPGVGRTKQRQSIQRCSGNLMRAQRFVKTATGNAAGGARRKKPTRNSKPIYGNWQTALRRIAAKNAPGGGEQLECGHATTDAAECKNQSRNLAWQELGTVTVFVQTLGSATIAQEGVKKRKETKAIKAYSKYRKSPGQNEDVEPLALV